MTQEFRLGQAVPFGRDRSDYTAFFALDGLAPKTRILDCAGGPSSFTAEMTRVGFNVLAADPLYDLSRQAITDRIDESSRAMLAGLRKAKHRFIWSHYGTPERAVAARRAAMQTFLDDYERGLAEGRYVAAALPNLPFEDGAFDVVVCSHFLFLYSAQLDEDFHLAAIREMLRVGHEARIFPLLDLDGAPSRHLEPICAELQAIGYRTDADRIGYEFQKGGDRMLRVTAAGNAD